MASFASSSVWYVYGIVPSTLSAAQMPAGLDDAPVSLVSRAFDVAAPDHSGGSAAALLSVLDGARYAAEAIEASSADVEWLSPRAIAHDRVLTWASDHGPVIPLPMFSLFSGREAVERMLSDRGPELSATLDRLREGREYALRVYRVDAEFLGAVAMLSPRLAELAAAAAAAAPGQRYLLERKLEAEKKAEVRAVSLRLVDEISGALGAHALRHIRSPIPRVTAADAAGSGQMILNAAFFVAPATLEAFQRTLTSLVERYGAHGLRFDFTGPWPPYHFAGAEEGERVA